MQIALVGLPWSGKTTLFNTLAAYAGIDAHAQTGTVNQCVVPVPDPRLERLASIFTPRRVTRATIEYLDVPGLDVRQQRGHGVPGSILARIKNAAALVEVLGGFAPDQPADPRERVGGWLQDREALETEMLIGDLTIVENRQQRIEKQLKKGARSENEQELELLARCEHVLSDGKPLRELALSMAEHTMLAGFQLLTQKPLLRLVNVGEEAVASAPEWLAAHWPDTAGTTPLVFSAAIESEIATLSPDERGLFLTELGIPEPLLPRLIRASQELLGLITFFTGGDKEVHAWTIGRGTHAPAAAGEIHTDMQRGFIRAEVVRFEDLDAAGSIAACRERGTLRIEGKDYVVEDGDVIFVRFNV